MAYALMQEASYSDSGDRLLVEESEIQSADDSTTDADASDVGCFLSRCCDGEGESSDESEEDDDEFEAADKYVAEIIQLREAYDQGLVTTETTESTSDPLYEFVVSMNVRMEQMLKEINGKLQKKCAHIRANGCTFVKKYEERSGHAFDIMIQAAGSRTSKFLNCFVIDLEAQEWPGILAQRRFQYESTTVKMALGPLALLKRHEDDQSFSQVNEFFEEIAAADPQPRTAQVPSDPDKLKEFEFRWLFLHSLLEAFGPYVDFNERLGFVDSMTRNFDPVPKERAFGVIIPTTSRSTDGSRSIEDVEDETPSHWTIEDVITQLARLRQMLSSLTKVEDDQHVFETVAAQALVLRTELACKVQFWISFALSFTILVALVYLTWLWNYDPKWLNNALTFYAQEGDCGNGISCSEGYSCDTRCMVAFFFYIVAMICNFVELFIIVLDGIVSRAEWINSWNLLDFFVEASSFVFLIGFKFYDMTNAPTHKPFLFPCVILIRWIKTGLLVFYMHDVGPSLLPILLAVSSRPAMIIFEAITLLSIAGTHAYFGFRVLENDKTYGEFGFWGVFTCFLTLSRMFMFADGDIDSMAGRREAIFDVGTHGEIDGEDSGSWGEVGQFKKHYQSITIFTWLTLLLGVVIMNVYVGVLEDKYAEFNAHREHYFYQWRAIWQMRALNRRKLWAVMGYHMCHGLRRMTLSPLKRWPVQPTRKPQPVGLFIVSAGAPADDISQLEDAVKGLQRDVADINDNLDKLWPRKTSPTSAPMLAAVPMPTSAPMSTYAPMPTSIPMPAYAPTPTYAPTLTYGTAPVYRQRL